MLWRSTPSWPSSTAGRSGRRSTGNSASGLRGKPLALWLHGFYASHAAPYSLTVAYLHKLSGSRTKQLKHFKQNLIRALRDLEAVGAIQAFEIRDELVHVRTVPSKSQQKHLAARRPPDRRRK